MREQPLRKVPIRSGSFWPPRRLPWWRRVRWAAYVDDMGVWIGILMALCILLGFVIGFAVGVM